MLLDQLTLWAGVVTLGAFALFVQATAFVRQCLFRPLQQNWWKYPIVALPLAMSLWSFVVAEQAMQTGYTSPLHTNIHLTLAFYLSLKAQFQEAINGCVLQTILIILTYAFTFLAEDRAFPHKRSIPAWVIAQDLRMRV